MMNSVAKMTAGVIKLMITKYSLKTNLTSFLITQGWQVINDLFLCISAKEPQILLF